jgi:Tol biopolymer transport system component
MRPRTRLVLVCLALFLSGCASRRARATDGPGQKQAAANLLAFLTLGEATASGETGPGLWLMDRDGGHRRQIGAAAQGLSFAWSPRGASIAYVADHSRITLYSLSDGRSRTFSPGSRTILGGPAWFPDGRRLAFTWLGRGLGAGGSASTGISILDTTTGHIEDLYTAGQTPESFPFRAAVRPDGAQMGVSSRSAIFLMELGGDTPHSLKKALDVSPMAVRYFEWSPDSAFIAYTTVDEDGSGALWAYEVATGRSIRVSSVETRAPIGGWHPKLAQLAFAVAEGTPPRSRVWVATLEHAEWHSTPMLSADGFVGVSGWSDDGTAFAYVRGDGESSRIYVAKADGSDAHPVSPPGAHDRGASWQPVPLAAPALTISALPRGACTSSALPLGP